jgi:hypothetical protein
MGHAIDLELGKRCKPIGHRRFCFLFLARLLNRLALPTAASATTLIAAVPTLHPGSGFVIVDLAWDVVEAVRRCQTFPLLVVHLSTPTPTPPFATTLALALAPAFGGGRGSRVLVSSIVKGAGGNP